MNPRIIVRVLVALVVACGGPREQTTARAQSVTQALVQAEQRARKLSDELWKVKEERGRVYRIAEAGA